MTKEIRLLGSIVKITNYKIFKIAVYPISYSLKGKKNYVMGNAKRNSLECHYNINLKEFLLMDIELQSQKQHSLAVF
jgi:hypothetical protein